MILLVHCIQWSGEDCGETDGHTGTSITKNYILCIPNQTWGIYIHVKSQEAPLADIKTLPLLSES